MTSRVKRGSCLQIVETSRGTEIRKTKFGSTIENEENQESKTFDRDNNNRFAELILSHEEQPIENLEDDGVKRKNPRGWLGTKATSLGLDISSKEFASVLDDEDPCKELRGRFCYPTLKSLNAVKSEKDEESECVYMCGNSLGLRPKRAEFFVQREMRKWAESGVEGHFEGDVPWATCDELGEEEMARIVGAERDEVVIMNSLTVNLHLALVAFYDPNPTRFKILFEDGAFPSDHYAFQSQVMKHGLDPEEALMVMAPRDGEETLRTEDILDVIEREGDSIALVCFPGVQYYTGQLFDIASITAAGHAAGCVVGWDLAHAVGNVPLHLHQCNVDFAIWCTYKYLNSGAGALGGLFVHNAIESRNVKKLNGWWSHDLKTRFKMDNVLDESRGAKGFRLANPSIFSMCPILASLEVFAETSMSQLRGKSLLLTAYLELLLTRHLSDSCRLITPKDPEQRGAQLSLQFSQPFKKVHEKLSAAGVVCDFREPAVVRIAPAPLYNSFDDVHRFVHILQSCLKRIH